MRRNAEYIVCFAKNIKSITELIGEIKNKEGLPSLTKSSMKEKILTFPANTVITYLDNGSYKAGVKDSYELLDDVEVKDGLILNSFRLKGHVIWGQENLEKEIKLGTQIIIKGEGFVPYTKKAGDSVMSPTKLIPNHIVGDILSSNAEMAKLFSEKVFSYPKPVTLLEYLIHYFNEKDFIVLDFFSGSSTTAHAVMSQNLKDNGNRKFIMVQLPENLDNNFRKASDKEGGLIKNAINLCDKLSVPHLLTEVAKERIRRAGKKIKEEAGEKAANLDIGFRVLKLDTSNMEDVYYTPQEFELQSLFNENVKADRTNEDLLFQVMLDLGIELSAKIESKQIAGKNVHFVDDNYLVACFDCDVNESTITEISKLQPIYFVMRDASAANDNVIDNFEQIFKHYSPDTNCRII
jgi:adenine-specific DNA-methyltransferase